MKIIVQNGFKLIGAVYIIQYTLHNIISADFSSFHRT